MIFYNVITPVSMQTDIGSGPARHDNPICHTGPRGWRRNRFLGSLNVNKFGLCSLCSLSYSQCLAFFVYPVLSCDLLDFQAFLSSARLIPLQLTFPARMFEFFWSLQRSNYTRLPAFPILCQGLFCSNLVWFLALNRLFCSLSSLSVCI